MSVFTQICLTIAKLTPQAVQMVGSGFFVGAEGLIATTWHVVANDPGNLCVLVPHILDLNTYQDTTETQCKYFKAEVVEADPVRDLAILKVDMRFSGTLPTIGGFDDVKVGEELVILGFPHATTGRRVLTFQQTFLGAKALMGCNGVKTKHGIINTQARPGQSGSMVYSSRTQSIVGVLEGAYVPPGGEISLGGINPHELHQTTHCISAEYLKNMVST